MMVAGVKSPLTNDELLALIDVDGFYRFPASIDDYWNLLSEAQHRADYYDHHVMATISYESDIHSRIAARFNGLLLNSYDYVPGFVVYNSNRPLYVEAYSGAGTGRSADAVFNANGMVVSMPRNPHEYRPALVLRRRPFY